MLVTVAESGTTPVGDAVTESITALFGFLDSFWQVCYDALLVWALVLIIVALMSHHRLRLLWTELLAGAISLGLIVAAGEASGSTWSDVLTGIWRTGPDPIYPAARLALASAVIVAASPHLSRPLRFTGRWILCLGATASIVLGTASWLGVLVGLLVGLGSAAIAHLLLGSPGGRLSDTQVEAALLDLGVEVVDLHHATLQPSGVELIEGADADGRPLLVKVYGRDAWDGQLILSTLTALSERGQAPHMRSRWQQVEHEAFVTLIAERAGIAVMPVEAAGMARGRDALLVTRNEGRPLAELDLAAVDDRLLAKMWHVVLGLGAEGIAHGSLNADHFLVQADGSVTLTGFREATIPASELAHTTDRAELLVATALLVGQDRAVAAAASALGPERLASILPCIQPAILDRADRQALRRSDWDLDDLRGRAAAAAGVESPELEQLRRVTWRSFVKVILIAFVAFSVTSAVTEVGLRSLIDAFASADPLLLLGAFVLAPVVQVAQAFSTIGASVVPLRFLPAVMLQYAIQFIQLAVPSSAARIAMSIRFFQRNGLTSTGAVATGAVDSLSGFLVQAVLILTITLTGLASLSGDIGAASSGDSHHIVVLLVMLVVAGLAIVGVVFVVRPFRMRVAAFWHRIREPLRAKRADAAASLRVLHQPSKVLLCLGGNLLAQYLQAVVLGLCLAAFGEQASMAELLLINSAVSLFAGFMPVPGGIGVAEAAYTAAFVAIGVPNTLAMSTAIAFRGVTYYLPPIYGALAARWLRRHSYL